MRRYRTLGLIILTLTLCNLFYASEYPGAVFLEIWPGARPTGLAGSYSAIADDASAAYYNVGGLAFLENNYATIMHSNWLPGLYEGMYYDFLGFSRTLKNQGTIGANVIYLTTGKTEVTDENGNYLGEYTTFDISIGGSYGFKVTPQLGAGVSAKFIYSYLVAGWVFDAMPGLGIERGGTGLTWALDIGALYKPLDYLSVGLSLANIGPNISYTSSGESDPLPRMLRLGVKYRPVNQENFQLNITPELTKILVGLFYDPSGEKTFGQKLNYELWEAWKSIGIEAKMYQIFSARLGYFEDVTGQRGGILVTRDDREEHITLSDFIFKSDRGKFANKVGLCFGVGVEFKGFQVDVSNDQMIYDFPTSNYKFSFTYRF